MLTFLHCDSNLAVEARAEFEMSKSDAIRCGRANCNHMVTDATDPNAVPQQGYFVDGRRGNTTLAVYGEYV